MATVVLQVAGAAVGGLFGPVGAVAGRALGALAGAAVDGAIFGSGGAGGRREGPRLKDLDGITASEGEPIPRVYGRVRVGGQVIWATRFEEQATIERAGRSGGKSTGARPSTVSYAYFANVAIGLCEGPVALIRRIYADGKPLDLDTVTIRFHLGDENQPADPLIEARQGASPGYRGLAYVVFERFPLAAYGNRLPQFSFEVVRPLGGLPRAVRALDLIPGSSEFGYDPRRLTRTPGLGVTEPETRHQLVRGSDWTAALDDAQGLMPALRRVALVVSWFGDDLRLAQCRIRPKVEVAEKTVDGATWSAGGLQRHEAEPVSTVDGRPAYGGTPSDEAVIRAIRDLSARGLAVTLYPFVLMDIPAGNALADPYTGSTGQAPHPWRGRITCDPAPGRAGSPEGTAAIAAHIAAFFGTAAAADFAVANDAVLYSGPDEWSFRRHILHNAALAKAAGGVEAFVIGSELVGLTRLSAAPGFYPAAAALADLAADVKLLLPAAKVTYAADWTEYGAEARGGGSELRFPLDPLWASPAIDAVGIDFYPPLTDWRDGRDHADAPFAYSAADPAYLAAGLAGGEGFDWYYADAAGREAQERLPISDGAYGKPWVYRVKDLAGWWSNPHVERSGGAETGATAFVPRAKPIWLMEIGCPAVDRGGNGPNVFPDPKSSESAFPPFSRAVRDDLVQRRFLEAVLARFDPALPGHDPAANPVSPLYGGRMVDPDRLFVWCWDARPFPAFPHLSAVWADGINHQTGHWLTGRIEGCPLDRLIAAIFADSGLPTPLFERLDGFVDGYVVDRPMSVRAALEPLMALFGVTARPRGDTLAFSGPLGAPVLDLTRDDLAPGREGDEIRRLRAQETELPRSVTLGFVDGERDFRRATAQAIRFGTSARGETFTGTSAVLRREEAVRLAEAALEDAWVGRESLEFRLRPNLLALEPGDLLALPPESGGGLARIERITAGASLSVRARAFDPAVHDHLAAPRPPEPAALPLLAGPPHVEVLDLPLEPGPRLVTAYAAVAATPWGGPYALLRAAAGAGLVEAGVAMAPQRIGRLAAPLGPGPLWRWDPAAAIDLILPGAALASVTREDALAGRNLLALKGADGAVEIVAFREAVATGPDRHRLAGLLRGLGGSEEAAARLLPAGAVAVVLDETLLPLSEGLGSVGIPFEARLVPVGRGLDDPAAAAFTFAGGRAALRPLAPVRARARRLAEGIELRWIRRTRIGGDAFDLAEVPLGEEREAYELDILSGAGAVLSTLRADAPAALYPAAAELEDFGVPQGALSIRLAQVSASIGRGAALARVLPVL